MKRIAPHLHRLSGGLANVWLLEDQGKRFLIDTGHAIERLTLLAALWKSGVRRTGDLTAVLLTHRHSDHAGNAAWVRKHLGAPVICHEQDAAILRGDKPAPRRGHGTGALYKKWLRGFEERRPAFSEVDEAFQDGSWKWGFRVTTVPGHTEGSVMLHHEPSSTLFSGDSILVRSKAPRFADPAFSLEPEASRRSVRKYLQELPPTEILCSGHGPAIDEQAFRKLKKLLAL